MHFIGHVEILDTKGVYSLSRLKPYILHVSRINPDSNREVLGLEKGTLDNFL
jgi:hypothetical protein